MACWILPKAFSASIEIIVLTFLFKTISVIMLIDLWRLNHVYIFRIKPTWSITFLIHACDSLRVLYWKTLTYFFILTIGPLFSFLDVSLPGIIVKLDSYKELGRLYSYLHSFFFFIVFFMFNTLRRFGCRSFFAGQVEFCFKSICAWAVYSSKAFDHCFNLLICYESV